MAMGDAKKHLQLSNPITPNIGFLSQFVVQSGPAILSSEHSKRHILNGIFLIEVFENVTGKAPFICLCIRKMPILRVCNCLQFYNALNTKKDVRYIKYMIILHISILIK